MPFALFVLALWVLLQSAPAFSWFTVDPKFSAFIGLVFVIVVVLEALAWFNSDHVFPWFKRKDT